MNLLLVILCCHFGDGRVSQVHTDQVTRIRLLPLLTDYRLQGELLSLPDVATNTLVAKPATEDTPHVADILASPFSKATADAARVAWSKRLGLPAKIVFDEQIELLLIPPGEFDRGSDDKALSDAQRDFPYLEKEWLAKQTPTRRVRITNAFYMSTFEITQAQYSKIVGRNPSEFSSTGVFAGRVEGSQTDNFPVDNVSWYEAVLFCNALSKQHGKTEYYKVADVKYHADSQRVQSALVTAQGGDGFRLPTEAEWEYSCRAGTMSLFSFGDGKLKSAANVEYMAAQKDDKFAGRTMRVGTFKANPFGLYDMHGNVSEWCFDCFDANYYSRSPANDPKGPSCEQDRFPKRVLRGGSHSVLAGYATSASRYKSPADVGTRDYGFRIVRSPK